MDETNVKIHYEFYSGMDLYSDGIIEDEMLSMAKKLEDDEDTDELIKEDKRWPILYHFSRTRRNIVEAMDFKASDIVLEIGAGCGALSGRIASKCKKLDCIELSKKRSLINAYRNKKYRNMDIYVGEFSNIKLDNKYDVVLLIGVLEYAGKYCSGDNPFLDLLKKVRNLLKENGRIYIGIENKFGLKYFAGSHEDHSQIAFQGIEGYKQGEVETFSNIELRNLLKEAGYGEIFFYYPVPDYKMPSAIYSEKHLPRIGEIRNTVINFDQPREIYFDEEKAFDNIIKSGHYETFANSFLVLARRGD